MGCSGSINLPAQDQKSAARSTPAAVQIRSALWFRPNDRPSGFFRSAALVIEPVTPGQPGLPGRTCLIFSPRMVETMRPFCTCARRAHCLICSQRTIETVCPPFFWAGSENLPTFLRQHETVRTRLPTTARDLPTTRGHTVSFYNFGCLLILFIYL